VEQSIVDCLAVGQVIDGGSDERVILFVKLPNGQNMSGDLEQKIRGEVRKRRSPRHVPAQVRFMFMAIFRNITNAFVTQIIQVTDIPYTLNGKRVEVLVKKVNDPHLSLCVCDSYHIRSSMAYLYRVLTNLHCPIRSVSPFMQTLEMPCENLKQPVIHTE
jgi:hypothetical protein